MLRLLRHIIPVSGYIKVVYGLGVVFTLAYLFPPRTTPQRDLGSRGDVHLKDSSRRRNVLFLMSDDLRPQLNCYADTQAPSYHIHSPRLDALAARSLLLERAYVQLSMCGPSRASILTGRRPDTTKVWTQKTYWRRVGGNFTTIPQFFRENGYITAGVGKIFHPRKASGKDDPMSWTDPYYHPPDKRYWRKLGVSWRAFSRDELREMPHPDHMIAEAAIAKLRDIAARTRKTGENFFLGVGFLKPHLPFSFPEEFLDFYPWDDVDTAANPNLPVDFPTRIFSKPSEVLAKTDIAKLDFHGGANETMPRGAAKSLRRAYSACVSFIDHLVGRVLDELKALGLASDTVVSFIGDHGWHLGENGMWGKHTNMEQGTRSPMMLHIPGRTDSGVTSKSIVEFVDLFPTLAEAAGLGSVSPCPENDSSTIELCTQGVSLLPLIDKPALRVKQYALSQHKLYGTPGMGYSIRGDQFRYTEWPRVTRTRLATGRYEYRILWDSLVGAELYDHTRDPGETVNRAADPGYQDHMDRLRVRLRQMVGETIGDVMVPFD